MNIITVDYLLKETTKTLEALKVAPVGSEESLRLICRGQALAEMKEALS